MSLEPGLEGSVVATVEDGMTARALGSGDLLVLGTPAVLALVERAAVRALEGRLTSDQTSVGATVVLRHVAPTPVRAEVRAVARLTAIAGGKLDFEFEVSDPSGTVASGRHGRVIVDRARFLEGAQKRS